MIGIYKITNTVSGKMYIGQSIFVEGRINGEQLSIVYLDYKDKLTLGSFTNVWSYRNWKDIVV